MPCLMNLCLILSTQDKKGGLTSAIFSCSPAPLCKHGFVQAPCPLWKER